MDYIPPVREEQSPVYMMHISCQSFHGTRFDCFASAVYADPSLIRSEEGPLPGWTFVTNHGAVLALVAHHGQITSREIAATLNITERSVLRIIKDLEDGGYLERFRDGRQNYYNVDPDLPLRREDARHVAIGELLVLLMPRGETKT